LYTRVNDCRDGNVTSDRDMRPRTDAQPVTKLTNGDAAQEWRAPADDRHLYEDHLVSDRGLLGGDCGEGRPTECQCAIRAGV